jgi:uncharacterized protein YkuJ
MTIAIFVACTVPHIFRISKKLCMLDDKLEFSFMWKFRKGRKLLRFCFMESNEIFYLKFIKLFWKNIFNSINFLPMNYFDLPNVKNCHKMSFINLILYAMLRFQFPPPASQKTLKINISIYVCCCVN